MAYRDARDTEFGTGHGVPDTRPDRTLCGLDTTLLIVRDEDWERGTHRTKCADCIVSVGRRFVTLGDRRH